MTRNRALGIAAMIAGGVILSLAASGGQLVTCGIRSGECTPRSDAIQDFTEVALFFFAGGIGLVALGIFLLVPTHGRV